MTTTFKVVEFYRNNNSINNFNSSSNLNTNNNNNNNNNSNNVNNTITLVNANNLNEKKENLLKKSLSNSNSLGLIESPAKNATKTTTTTTTTQIQILNNNHIFSSLGFNVIGGYLTEIPATIVDIDFNASNAKLLKVTNLFLFFSSLLYILTNQNAQIMHLKVRLVGLEKKKL